MYKWYCIKCDALLITEADFIQICFCCGGDMTDVIPLEYSEESIYNAPTLVSC